MEIAKQHHFIDLKISILYIIIKQGDNMPKEQEVREFLKRLRKEGWIEASGKGSHKVFRKDGTMIVVPTSKRELPLGTYRNIAKTAGWI